MKALIEQTLSLWGIGSGKLTQIYSSAWEIDHYYIMKVYEDRDQLERNIKISEILSDCNIPVAETVPTKTGEKYAVQQNRYFLLTRKLPGSNISHTKDSAMARKMGHAIARLHRAFARCEREMAFWDNSLLDEMKGWIRDNLAENRWQILDEEEYARTAASLESVYDSLPRQLIHRDVHFGNFLFHEGNLSGYIDFDLSQKNIRIFDICYFLTGALAEETGDAFTQSEWIESVQSAIAGYESILPLSADERSAVPWVMESIEILFIAYYIGTEDMESAYNAYHAFRFIRTCESALADALRPPRPSAASH